MPKPSPLFLSLAAGATTLAVIYRSWRHILRHVLRLPRAPYRIRVQREIPIEVEPGLTLMADHYLPRADKPLPVLLVRSPYGRELRGGPVGLILGFLLRRLAERGYHVIAQDTRGRYESDGEFDPFTHEIADGQATLRWIEQQPWFDADCGIGMTGPSYLGYTQYAAAIEPERVPHLKAIVPIMTSSQFHSVIHADGAFNLDMVLHWMQITFLAGRPKRQTKFISPQEEDRRLQRIFNELPLQDLDERLLGERVQFYRDALAHSDRHALRWRTINLDDRLDNIEAAAHLMTGWHDFMLRELLADYDRLVQAGRSPYLTIGPWHHSDPRYLLDSVRLSLDWFDAHLKGQRARLRTQPVRLYIMGADEWREYDHWPPEAQATRWYLHAGQTLSIEPPSNTEWPDHYRYDPADPTPNLGGPLINSPNGPVQDNRPLEARPDVLTYTTPPLDHDLTVIGPVRLDLYARSSLAHTDFFGRLCDVQPDGRSLNVCDGLLRVTSDSTDNAHCWHVEIDLRATAYRFKRGHQLRLIVSSSAHPRWARNLGTGEPLATGTRLLIAEQTILHDRQHPSALKLPVINEQVTRNK